MQVIAGPCKTWGELCRSRKHAGQGTPRLFDGSLGSVPSSPLVDAEAPAAREESGITPEMSASCSSTRFRGVHLETGEARGTGPLWAGAPVFEARNQDARSRCQGDHTGLPLQLMVDPGATWPGQGDMDSPLIHVAGYPTKTNIGSPPRDKKSHHEIFLRVPEGYWAQQVLMIKCSP